jgi:hypothetical protein
MLRIARRTGADILFAPTAGVLEHVPGLVRLDCQLAGHRVEEPIDCIGFMPPTMPGERGGVLLEEQAAAARAFD